MTLTEEQVFELGLDFPVIVADTSSVNATENREEWLRYRLAGIGGSDASVALGLSPWRSPYSLWAEKVHAWFDDVDNEKMRWGRRLEEPIAQEFAERTGLTVAEMPVLLAHPEHSWMLANVDRFVVQDGRIAGLLECKTTGAHLAEEWEHEEAPHHHLVQVYHYLAVTGLPKAWLCVLIGGQEFRMIEVNRDDQVIANIVAAEAAFWKLVEDQTPPAIDGSESTRDAIMREHGEPTDSEVDLPEEAIDLVLVKKATDDQIKLLEEQRDAACNKLRALLGDHTVGRVHGQIVATWKPHDRASFDKKRFTADNPEMAAKYTTTTKQRPLLVKSGVV